MSDSALVAVLGSPAESGALNQAFATIRYSANGKVVAANHQFLRLIGYELDELIGQDVAILRPDLSRENTHLVLWEQLTRGETQQQTALWIAKTGKELWLHSHYVPVRDDRGAVAEVIQFISDITDVQAKRSQERDQIAAINSSCAAIHFSLDGVILDANDRFLQMMGYDNTEVLGQHHSMFVDPGYRESADYRDFWQSLAAGDCKSGEYQRIDKSGGHVWLHAIYSPILDAAGRPYKIVEYASDMTAAKVKQADYEWQINAMQKSHSIVTFDMYGTILDANKNFLDATGYALDEISNRHHSIFVDASHAHGTEYATLWSDLRQGRHRSGIFRRYGKGHKEIWLHATYNPIFDAAGVLVKIIKFASIVTDERLLQADYQGQIAAINNALCVVSFALDGTILDANENFLDAVDYRFGEVRGHHHSMFVTPEEAESEDYLNFWKELAAGRHQSGEFKRFGRDGREIWLHATYNPILDMSGRPFKIVKYASHITASKLRQADYQGQIEAINKSQGVAVFGLDGTILDVNDNFLTTLGYELDEVKGRHHSMLVERDFARTKEYGDFWTKLRSGEFHSGMYKRIGKNGHVVWIQASYNPVLDLNGKPSKVIKYATDVSSNVALAEAFDDAKRQAQHDPATSLPNRVKLSAFMDSCLASPLTGMTVFYVDLDRFKPINDTFGHHVGDRVLGEVADRMRRALSDDQMVARVGGDEFVIAAPGMSVDSIERFCKRLFELVTAPIHHEGNDLSVGMSVGIAVAATDGSTPDALLRAADTALYRSKQNGRGIYSFYATEMNDNILAQRKLSEDMRHSLAAGHFYLEYQPRFDTRARRIRSVEALVRWAHPERGRIEPADFIVLAEQNGLIIPLGDWILHQACQTAVGWKGIGVSVNISGVQFRDGTLVSRVEDSLRSSGLPAGLLELEITESVLLEDADRAGRVLNDLKALGVKLAMDDFGTGYSSLSCLQSMPFDVIKIDRSFINELDTRPSARPIVQAILGLGRALGLPVTAEGVETNEQLALLTAEQCSEVQGFLMARPLKAEQIDALLAEIPILAGSGAMKTLAVA